MIKLAHVLIVAAATLLLATETSTCRSESATSSTESADSLLSAPSALKTGDASDDAVTSAAVEEILRRCAEQYRTAPQFYASGLVINAAKSKRMKEHTDSSKLEVWFRRPDLMRVSVTGTGSGGEFIADGTTVTFVNKGKKEHYEIPQPRDLMAFAEMEIDGDLQEDRSGALEDSLIAPLLIAKSPSDWLHANVVKYIYDGTEDIHVPDVAGKKKSGPFACWKIRFIQKDPELVVTNWIDKETFFLRKVSIISARDADGESSHSYEKAVTGTFQVSMYGQISTDPARITDAAFKYKLPTGFKEATTTPTAKADTRASESGWTRIVRAAAAQSGKKTSATLVTDIGKSFLTLEPVYDANSRIEVLCAPQPAPKTGPRLLAGTANRQIVAFDAGSSEPKVIAAPAPLDHLCLMERPDAPPLLITGETNTGKVTALNLDGTTEWTYARLSAIRTLDARTLPSGSLLYVLFQNSGIWALDHQGKVAHASKRFNSALSFSLPRTTSSSVDLIAHDYSDLAAFSAQLRLLQKSSLSQVAGALEIDSGDTEWPIIGINFDREDLLLQRMNLDGGLSWTLTAALSAGEVGGAALYLANLRLPTTGQIGKVIVTLLSDGRLAIASLTGESIYRGRFTTDKIVDRDGKSWVAFGLAVADMDEDGEDELYTAIDSQLVRLRTVK